MKLQIYFLGFLLFISLKVEGQWYQQSSGTTSDLNSVFFIDENTGWVCGSNGVIVKTTNGGMDWFEQNSNTTALLNTIQFVDYNNGWACGEERILRTTDGGLSWISQIFPLSTYFVSLQFIDVNIGWIIYQYSNTSYIAKTTNSGDTWNILNQAPNEYYEAMYFIDENTGWVAVGGSGVLRTMDGGSNWTQHTANLTGSPMNIRFVDSLNGWLSHNTLGSYTISKSTDGGITWFIQISESGKFVHSISFPNSSIGYAAGFQMFSPPLDEEFIIKTTNGGSEWFEQYRDAGILNSIFFHNDILGWATGSGGKIVNTENGGVPVELISFTASTSLNSIILQWITATELNNLGFEIERTPSISPPKGETPGEWKKIGFAEGKGTTTETNYYSFIDEGVSPGKYYYRLKQIDFDGTYEYSKEIEVEVGLPDKFSLSQNYPNPFNPSTSIEYRVTSREYVALKVYDVLGREVTILVNEEKQPGVYEVEFQSSVGSRQLATGVYYYQFRAGSYIETKKMIYLK